MTTVTHDESHAIRGAAGCENFPGAAKALLHSFESRGSVVLSRDDQQSSWRNLQARCLAAPRGRCRRTEGELEKSPPRDHHTPFTPNVQIVPVRS